MHSESRQLLARVDQGDRDALDSLFSREAARLRRLLTLRAGASLLRRAELDDLVQETYLEAVRQLDNYTYQGRDSFFRWLGTIAMNRMNNLRRTSTAKKRDAAREVGPRGSDPTITYVAGEAPAPGPGPRTLTASGEQLDRLDAALERLSPDDRQVILLARVEGLSLAEVAARMGRTRNAVALLLSRALRKLGRQLQPEDAT